MNVVVLVGNLASAPELVTTTNGTKVCNFRLAVSRQNGQDADFLDIKTFGRTAEICSEYLAIGRRVAIEGRLNHATWRTENDEPRSKVEVIANRVEMLGKKPSSASSEQAADTTSEDQELVPAGVAGDSEIH